MDRAHELAAAGAAHGTAVAARTQEAGRGRRGRTWESPPGGLWLSVICRPAVGAHPECLSLRIGLAVARALESALPALPLIQLKWPNDLYLDDRKVGGILCEGRWESERAAWIVCGVGINVCNIVSPGLAGSATRLMRYAPDVDPDLLAEPVATAVARVGRRADPLNFHEMAELTRRDWLRGRALALPVTGTAAGIAADGALLVLLPGNELVPVRAGEIVLRRP